MPNGDEAEARLKSFYFQHAEEFGKQTRAAILDPIWERFLPRVQGRVLDVGCGPGRDLKRFQEAGLEVVGIDSCAKFVKMAQEYAPGAVVIEGDFRQLEAESQFDGIWACASLLHVLPEELPEVLERLFRAVKPGGILYVSFRHGTQAREVDGRWFTDANEERLRGWLAGLDCWEWVEHWLTDDVRPGKEHVWFNCLLQRKALPVRQLIPGGEHPFLPHLCREIQRADEVDVAVAFTKITGLRLILPDLEIALRRDQPVRLRFLTSDYLGVTDPEALQLLMLLVEQGAEVRVFEAETTGFHLKAWIFTRQQGREGVAFVGSSNITAQALQEGLEWNYRVSYPPDQGLLEARNRFEELFRRPETVALDDAWIERYRKRRRAPLSAIEPGTMEREAPPEPTELQQQALAALAQTRRDQHARGLVVMATGLGKTWLAAFDAVAAGAKRILFVAHRDEILNQAAETFLRIRPRDRAGFYRGSEREMEVDMLFASVQTLGRLTHLERFDRKHFDYVVVDEFHHAAAATYRKVLRYFEPRFLLGLTATPERADQADILALCDGNLVYSCSLFDGVEKQLLCPFHYYGIYDDAVDYREIPWRRAQLDLEALEVKLATKARAAHALKEWRNYGQQRTLGFCVGIRHAEFMAEEFRAQGIRAGAVHGRSTLGRAEALAQLREGELEVVFSVDLFNEGVDLPEIDTVLLLRPTDSPVLFLQQIGRGLRRHATKEQLVILDFIGNDQAFLSRPAMLAAKAGQEGEFASLLLKMQTGEIELGHGCFLNFDLRMVDFLRSLKAESLGDLYQSLKGVMGRRPTRLEFHYAGANKTKLRQMYDDWYSFLVSQGDGEVELPRRAAEFLAELEKTALTKSFKLVLLEAFGELEGWSRGVELGELADRSWAILGRRPELKQEVAPDAHRDWQGYWRKNPVRAWIREERDGEGTFFALRNGRFASEMALSPKQQEWFEQLVGELVEFRWTEYGQRPARGEVVMLPEVRQEGRAVRVYEDLRIACGHFRAGETEKVESIVLGGDHGALREKDHFVARARGNSMNGGREPVQDGDWLLFERSNERWDAAAADTVVVLEQTGEGMDEEYLLRRVKRSGKEVRFVADAPGYADEYPHEGLRVRARLVGRVSPWEMSIGKEMQREEIASLFGVEFNVGNWNLGYVVLRPQGQHVLLVTLDKQGREEEQQYLDHWVDGQHFYWQSQNSVGPQDKKGQELIRHREIGITVQLFVRDKKLGRDGKAAPFRYCGPVDYVRHEGAKPMGVVWRLRVPVS